MEKTHQLEFTKDEIALMVFMINTWEVTLPNITIETMKHEDVSEFSELVLPTLKSKIATTFMDDIKLTKPKF